jgi:hypothetical protein
MSFWTDIEAEFNAVIADARSLPEKLEALVGIRNKAAEMTALEQKLTDVINDGSIATPDKVTAILQAVGKL